MRIGKFDKVRRARFLKTLAETANVTRSAEAAGISKLTAYIARDKSPLFRAAWQAALEHAIDTLEEEARRRAVEGWEKPVFYQGRPVGAVREYSDSLLMFLLRVHRPERFRER